MNANIVFNQKSAMTLLSRTNSEGTFFLIILIHLLVYLNGLYGYFRKNFFSILIFSITIIVLTTIDFIYAYTEIKNAYENRILPFNFVLILSMETYLSINSIQFAFVVHGKV